MNTKLSQDYITLELHKVLEALSREAANEKTKEIARNLTPETDPERVRYALQQTEDAFQLSVRFGAPAFDSFHDVCTSVRHTQSGARVSLKELLEIARLLRQISSLADWYAHCAQVQTTLSDLFERLRPNPYLADLLERSIETEERLADAASPALGQIRRKLAQAGVKLTPAGAGFPYGKDPSDSYIRIAPTFPAVDDLKKAAELLCICSIMVALENNAPLEV